MAWRVGGQPWQPQLPEEEAIAAAVAASLQPDSEEEALAATIAASLQPPVHPDEEAFAAAIAASAASLQPPQNHEERQPTGSRTCSCGHQLVHNPQTRNSCDVGGAACKGTGTTFTCGAGCDYDVCDVCGPATEERASIGRMTAADEGTVQGPCPERAWKRLKITGADLVGAAQVPGHSSSSSSSASGGVLRVNASDMSLDAEQSPLIAAVSRDGLHADSAGSTVASEGWVVVKDVVLATTPAQLGWLREHVSNGVLRTEVYTGRKTCSAGVAAYERSKPTALSFGLLPELETEWSNISRNDLSHVPGSEPNEGTFNFQRVRVQAVRGAELDGEVRVVVEWQPSLALVHMASMLRSPASKLFLSCKLGAIQPRGWKAASDVFDHTGWRCLNEQDEHSEFFLRGCLNELPAVQPPRFRCHLLRPEQLRSLRWMVDREARPANFSSELTCRYVPGVEWESQPDHWTDFMSRKVVDYWQGYEARSGFPWCYEATLKATFSSTSGVLGDAIGSGKTATLIGLLDTQRKKPPASHELMPDAKHLIPTAATLILVPGNLLGQWEGEFAKFLGPDAFKFLVIRSVTALKEITAQELTQCEVVLTTYKILYSLGYVERLKSLSCTRTNRHHERIFLGAPIEKTLACFEEAVASVLSSSAEKVGWTLRNKTEPETRAAREAEHMSADAEPHAKLLSVKEVEERIKTLGVCKDWRQLPFPVFELFFWHRIVFDEFHELEAMDRRRQGMLANLRCQCRWGLTGTPPKRDMTQIVQLARMLRVRVADDDQVQCQQFLDTFVRQNFAELPEIPVKEHMVIVEQTLEERALYLQQTYDGNRKSLLQFCSHHCLRNDEEDESESANDSLAVGPSARSSVKRLESKKKEGLARQRKLVTGEYHILAAVASGQGEGYRNGKAETDAAAKLSEIEEQARAVRCTALDMLLNSLPSAGAGSGLVRSALNDLDASRADTSVSQVLRALAGSGSPSLPQLRAAHVAQLGHCHAALAKLLSMTRSLRFLEASLDVLRCADGNHEAPECPLCLESMSPDTAALLPCAHAFHMGCVGMFGAGSHMCPTCRAPFKQGQVALVGHAASSGQTASSILAPSPDVERFGSKLVKICETLKEIQRKDPEAKAIVFVQWKVLETLVGESLRGMGIEFARLTGTTVSRSRLIAEFQENATPRVLLQSLENSASGANLTRASHVLLVHPMDASSHERAVAYEMQALGRVRRCGQTAKHVHLHRFVTRGTVEEDITREHQAGVIAGIRASNGGQSAPSSSGVAGGS